MNSKNILFIALVFFFGLGIIVHQLNEGVEEKILTTEQKIYKPLRQVVQTRKSKPRLNPSKTNGGVSNKNIQDDPYKGKVVRKTRVMQGGEYTESLFFIDNKEIARIKESSKGIIEQKGHIPNGKVYFFDVYKNTYGEENYRDGKKEGSINTYFSDGKLKSEATYQLGFLIAEKEYYANGNLRFEVDYRNALDLDDDPEVGVGKLYYSDGTMKYEWNLTRGRDRHYKRSYNRDGQLRHEVVLDSWGRPIE